MQTNQPKEVTLTEVRELALKQMREREAEWKEYFAKEGLSDWQSYEEGLEVGYQAGLLAGSKGWTERMIKYLEYENSFDAKAHDMYSKGALSARTKAINWIEELLTKLKEN